MKTNKILILALLVLPSCSFYKDKKGFGDVSLETNKRIPQDIVWRDSSEEDKNIQDRIAAILAEPLTASDVIQLSLLNNYNLQAEYQNLGLSQAQLVQAGLLSNPSLSLTRRFPGKAAEFDVTHNFLSILLLPMKKSMAEHEFEAAKLNIVKKVLDQAFLSKELFYKYLAIEQEIKLLEEKVSTAEASLDVSKALRTAGNITALALQSNQQMAAEKKLELITKNSEKVQLREKLNIAMGLSGEQLGWSISSHKILIPKKEFTGVDLQEVAIGNRPDLLALNQHVIAKGKQIGITNIESLLPDFTVTSHFEKEPDGSSSTGPEFSFPIPIFNMGDAQRGAARNFLAQAQSEYQALGITIRADVRSAQAQIELSRSRLEYLINCLLPLQETKLKQGQLQYNGMFIGATDLLNLKSEQIDTKLEIIRTIKEYWLLRISLEQAIGKELPLGPENMETVSFNIHKNSHSHHSH